MNALISYLFPIREGEWSSAFWFFCIQASFAFGAAITRSVGFTLLIGKLGNDFLPIAFILVDLTVMLGSFSYAVLTKRFTGIHILYGFVLVACAFSVLSWLLFSLQSDWVYGLFFVGFFSLHILISIHLIGFTVSYYTPVQSKRVMGFILAGIPVGGALGGVVLLVLINLFSPQTLVLTFGIGALGGAFYTTRIANRLSPHNQAVAGTAQWRAKRNQWREHMYAFWQIPLIRYMALGLMLFVIASRILEFQYQGLIYPHEYPDMAERTAFFGRYELIANLLWLLIQLFVSSRVLVSLGIGGSNLVHPVLMAGASAGLVLSFSFLPALIAQFINQELRYAIRSPANNLLLNAIPSYLWANIQTLLNGVVFPFSTIIASGLLLWMQNHLDSAVLIHVLPLVTFLLAVTTIVLAWPQWQAYNLGIIELLQQKVRRRPPGSKNLEDDLRVYLNQDDAHQLDIALEMVRSLNNPAFIPLVGKRLLKSRDYAVKRECARTLASLPNSMLSLKYLLRSLSFERDPETLALILTQLRQFPGESSVRTANRFLLHPYPEVFSAACYCLLEQNQKVELEDLRERVLIRLRLESPAQRLYSIKLLGQIADPSLDDKLAPFLNSDDPVLNLAAFQARVSMHKDRLAPFLNDFVKILETDDHNKKRITLKAMRRCPAPSDWSIVVDQLSEHDLVVVDYAQQLLRQNLAAALPELLNAVRDEKKPLGLRKRALMLSWGRISNAQKHDLLEHGRRSLERYLLSRVQSYRMRAYKGPNHPRSKAIKALLLKLLAEHAHQSLAWSLYLVAQNNREALSFADRLLCGLESDNVRDKGNALEALSNCSKKQLTDLLLSIFDKPLENELSIKKIAFSEFTINSERLYRELDISAFTNQVLLQETWRYWHQ